MLWVARRDQDSGVPFPQLGEHLLESRNSGRRPDLVGERRVRPSTPQGQGLGRSGSGDPEVSRGDGGGRLVGTLFEQLRVELRSADDEADARRVADQPGRVLPAPAQDSTQQGQGRPRAPVTGVSWSSRDTTRGPRSRNRTPAAASDAATAPVHHTVVGLDQARPRSPQLAAWTGCGRWLDGLGRV